MNLHILLNASVKNLFETTSIVQTKLKFLQHNLRHKKYYSINSLGELQFLGPKIDLLCAEISLLSKLLEDGLERGER